MKSVKRSKARITRYDLLNGINDCAIIGKSGTEWEIPRRKVHAGKETCRNSLPEMWK